MLGLALERTDLSPRDLARHYTDENRYFVYARVTGDSQLGGQLRSDIGTADLSPTDRVVLALATKFARNTYKVTEKDAISLRETGLDDEAYVDILNTVSIQTSLDRLANVLGVRPDAKPLLAQS